MLTIPQYTWKKLLCNLRDSYVKCNHFLVHSALRNETSTILNIIWVHSIDKSPVLDNKYKKWISISHALEGITVSSSPKWIKLAKCSQQTWMSLSVVHFMTIKNITYNMWHTHHVMETRVKNIYNLICKLIIVSNKFFKKQWALWLPTTISAPTKSIFKKKKFILFLRKRIVHFQIRLK